MCCHQHVANLCWTPKKGLSTYSRSGFASLWPLPSSSTSRFCLDEAAWRCQKVSRKIVDTCWRMSMSVSVGMCPAIVQSWNSTTDRLRLEARQGLLVRANHIFLRTMQGGHLNKTWNDISNCKLILSWFRTQDKNGNIWVLIINSINPKMVIKANRVFFFFFLVYYGLLVQWWFEFVSQCVWFVSYKKETLYRGAFSQPPPPLSKHRCRSDTTKEAQVAVASPGILRDFGGLSLSHVFLAEFQQRSSVSKKHCSRLVCNFCAVAVVQHMHIPDPLGHWTKWSSKLVLEESAFLPLLEKSSQWCLFLNKHINKHVIKQQNWMNRNWTKRKCSGS